MIKTPQQKIHDCEENISLYLETIQETAERIKKNDQECEIGNYPSIQPDCLVLKMCTDGIVKEFIEMKALVRSIY